MLGVPSSWQRFRSQASASVPERFNRVLQACSDQVKDLREPFDGALELCETTAGGGREKANGAAARQARWSYSGSSGAMAGSRPCLSPHTTADRSWTRLKRAAGAGHRHAISCPLCLAGLASRGAAGTSSLRLRAGGVVPSPRRRSPRSPRPAQSPVRGRSTGSSGE